MSALCLSGTSKAQLFSLLKSDFFLFCSFILSHPLYFLYFIFFSPYLLKVLSFLSPLFITTSLLLLALLTFSPSLIKDNFPKESSNNKASFLFTTYHAVVESLRSKLDSHDEESLRLEDFEVFNIVFGTPVTDGIKGSQVEILEPATEDTFFQALEAPEFSCLSNQDFSLSADVGLASNLGNPTELQAKLALMEEKRLECFLQQLDEFESGIATSVEEKKIEALSTKVNKAVEKQEEKLLVRNGSEAAGNKISQNIAEVVTGEGRQNTARAKVHSQRVGADSDYHNESGDYGLKVESSRTLDYNLGSYGSTRKEKDWKRTLACKLFEERHNVDGAEGMDSLWETYETESSKSKTKSDAKKKNKKKYEINYHEEVKKDDGEEDESDGQLCCLQALKFSAGKMNLGMGRPNLVRISKAIKGFGWLHHVSSRHSKKVHHGDRF